MVTPKRLGIGLLVVSVAVLAANMASRRRDDRRLHPVRSLLDVGNRAVPGLKPRVERATIRMFYEFVNRRGGESASAMMNYGYAPLDPDRDLELAPAEEPERLAYRMYQVVAGAVDLTGKDVLEVGCGRGGGAAFVMRHLAPQSVTGVDLADGAIAYCRATHRDDGLRFIQGDAEDLPFPASSFDAVLNVESSHAYPDFDRFLAEAQRVLRPSGQLLFADFRSVDQEPSLCQQFEKAGFHVLETENITANVLRSLDINEQRSLDAMQRSSPRLLRGLAREFFAVEGSQMRTAFHDGQLVYLRAVAQKS